MIKKALRAVMRRLGYAFIRLSQNQEDHPPPKDFKQQHIDIIRKVLPYTLTNYERLYALIEAVRYVVRNNIAGCFVECGVYKGGSMMAMALSLLSEGVRDRDLFLFDTYEGMPKPGERDIDAWGGAASKTFKEKRISDTSSTWANASLESVKKAMSMTGYPMERIHFVKGMVEDTIPSSAPDVLSLLRLDTDFYQSTLHEMTNLYPRLSAGGVLIVDDYGHFSGAREAIDEYFSAHHMSPLLHRVDYSARLIIKG